MLHHLTLLLHRHRTDFLTIRFQTYLIPGLWFRTYLIPTNLNSNISVSEPVSIQIYMIPNLSDSETIWFPDYLIVNLSDSKPIRYWTYQKPTWGLCRAEPTVLPQYPPLLSILKWSPNHPNAQCGEISNKTCQPRFPPLELKMTANPS
jgi:hypothetical protein